MQGKARPFIHHTIRTPQDLWNMLSEKVDDKTFPNISDAYRSYALLGLKIESYKAQIKDPEFLKSIEEMRQNNSIFEWLATLSESQKEGISFALQMDKESRYKQAKFV